MGNRVVLRHLNRLHPLRCSPLTNLRFHRAYVFEFLTKNYPMMQTGRLLTPNALNAILTTMVVYHISGIRATKRSLCAKETASSTSQKVVMRHLNRLQTLRCSPLTNLRFHRAYVFEFLTKNYPMMQTGGLLTPNALNAILTTMVVYHISG